MSGRETGPGRCDGNTNLGLCHDSPGSGETDQTVRLASVLNFTIVQQFVIEREIPGAGALSESQIRDIALHSLQALKEMGPQIQWLHSYVTEDKVYCVYLAPDEDSIREHARRAGIPADRVSAVRRLIDPAKLK